MIQTAAAHGHCDTWAFDSGRRDACPLRQAGRPTLQRYAVRPDETGLAEIAFVPDPLQTLEPVAGPTGPGAELIFRVDRKRL
jgi:hypothetical protein